MHTEHQSHIESSPNADHPEPGAGLTHDEEASLIKTLQDVIEVNLASRDVLKALAGEMDDLTLAATFRTIAGQRQRQANELKGLVTYERGDGDNHLGAPLENLNEAVDTGETPDVLSKLRLSEHKVAALYTDAVASTDGLSINGILQRHLRNTQTQLGRIQNLQIN